MTIQGHKSFNHLGVKKISTILSDELAHPIQGHGLPPGPSMGHRVKYLRYRENSGQQRDLQPTQAIRIAAASKLLMVMPDGAKGFRLGNHML